MKRLGGVLQGLLDILYRQVGVCFQDLCLCHAFGNHTYHRSHRNTRTPMQGTPSIW